MSDDKITVFEFHEKNQDAKIMVSIEEYGKLLERLTECENALQFYSNGWVKKHSHKAYNGYIHDVWKNQAVTEDGGRRARAYFEKWGGK